MTKAERLEILRTIAELQEQICKLPDGCLDPRCQELVEQVKMLNEAS
jgi:hypothetical protein